MEKKLEVVKFTDRSSGYGCSHPGNRAGKYVSVEDLLNFFSSRDDATTLLRVKEMFVTLSEK